MNKFHISRCTIQIRFSIEYRGLKIKSETITLNSRTDEFLFENTDYVGENTTNTLDFALGGYGNNFIPFYGYDFISLTGNSYVKASASADYEIFKKHHITVEGNWANVDNDIYETVEWFSLPDYRGYALGYGVETFLGPIQAKFTYSPEQRTSIWFFNIGFWF